MRIIISVDRHDFGIGTDITSIERFEKIFSKFGEQFLLKCYHPLEVAEFEKRLMPQPILQKIFLQKLFQSIRHRY